MTREDIIRIAKEVGFDDGEIETCQLMFEHFAYLVAQQEREGCAKVAEKTKAPFTATAIRARGQA